MKRVFSIYDVKAEAYLDPIFTATKGLAVRIFTEAVNTESHQFRRHASDYTLFEVGTWDEAEGKLTQHEAKISLGCAIEFLKNEEGD